MRRSTVSSVLFTLFIPTFATADETKQPSISTSGEAAVYVEPDEVVFQFGVETRDQSLDKAESLNDEAAKSLVAAVKKVGLDDKDISTAEVNVSIVYRDSRDLVISGYSVSRGYSVRLKDPKKFQTLVDAALKNGANRLNGFEFRTTQLRKFRDQARAMAIKAAREKAESLAAELKCKPGNPRTITETSSHAGYWGSNRDLNNMSQNAAQVMPSSGESDDAALPLGRIAVRASVNVTFDLIVP